MIANLKVIVISDDESKDETDGNDDVDIVTESDDDSNKESGDGFFNNLVS